jgi:hypothetical protein
MSARPHTSAQTVARDLSSFYSSLVLSLESAEFSCAAIDVRGAAAAGDEGVMDVTLSLLVGRRKLKPE